MKNNNCIPIFVSIQFMEKKFKLRRVFHFYFLNFGLNRKITLVQDVISKNMHLSQKYISTVHKHLVYILICKFLFPARTKKRNLSDLACLKRFPLSTIINKKQIVLFKNNHKNRQNTSILYVKNKCNHIIFVIRKFECSLFTFM